MYRKILAQFMQVMYATAFMLVFIFATYYQDI